MPKFSVIVPVLNEAACLPKALDSLIHQTSENFEVILVDGGSADGSLEIAREACEKYVDFFLIEERCADRFAALNRGLKAAEGEYVIFLSARDFITDETVERLIAFVDEAEKKPDIVVFRNYLFGEGKIPHFSEYDDMLAPVPAIPRYDNLVLRTLTLNAKCFRKSFLENRRLCFGAESAFADMLFVYQAFAAAKLTAGCPYAFYETRQRGASEPLAARDMPTMENLKACTALWRAIYDIAAGLIGEDSESAVDGSESYLQEVQYRAVCALLERFYARLWFMDDETYAAFAAEYGDRVERLDKEKRNKLTQMYGWLGAPYVFGARDGLRCFCTLVLKFEQKADYAPFLDSLYRQTFPFFEVILPDADADAALDLYAHLLNFHSVESDNFFAAARRAASSDVVLIVKDAAPLDENVLKNLRNTKAPLFLRQTVFARVRKALALRSALKEKGLNIR